MDKKFLEDDYCDIYKKKICDNCGECLEIEGIDTKAIKIEDISKKVEENILLEQEMIEVLELNDEKSESLTEEVSLSSWEDVLLEDDTYEDAFDHIEYLEDIDLQDDLTLEEMTIEVYPGVRKLKK